MPRGVSGQRGAAISRINEMRCAQNNSFHAAYRCKTATIYFRIEPCSGS